MIKSILGKYVKHAGCVLIIFCILMLIYMFVFNNHRISVYEIGNIDSQIKSPIFKELDIIRNKSYVLIADKTRNDIAQVLNINTGESNILHKAGGYQKFLYIAHPYKGLVLINFGAKNNIIDIDSFNLKDKKWNKLKTKLSIEKVPDGNLSTSIVYDNQNNPILFVWGGKNYKNVNTLKIIDIINDKFIQEIPFNYNSGSMLTLDNKNIYYLTNKTNVRTNDNVVNISDKKIKILPILTNNVQAYFISKHNDSSFLDIASERTPAFLAIDYENNTIVEYELNNDINMPIKTNKIELPKRYRGYKITNAIPQAIYGLILVLENDKKQLLVKFDIFHKTYKKNQDHRFEKITNLSKDIDLTNAICADIKDKTTIMYTKANKIMAFALGK